MSGNYNRKNASCNADEDFINQNNKRMYLNNTPFLHIVIPMFNDKRQKTQVLAKYIDVNMVAFTT